MIKIKKIRVISLLLILVLIMGLTPLKTNRVKIPLQPNIQQNCIDVKRYISIKGLYSFFEYDEMIKQHSDTRDESVYEGKSDAINDHLINQFYLLQNDLLQLG